MKKSLNGCAHTRLALLVMHLANEPLNALYTLLPVVLYKHLNASPMQLSLFITLRPLLSVFSFYWSSHLLYYRNKLLPNLIGAWILARIPFILLYFFPSIWCLFLAAAVYQLFSRAGVPAWIEIVKRNIPKKPREHLFSLYNVLGFSEGMLLTFFVGKVLDISPDSWSLLFTLAAAVALSSVIFQARIPIYNEQEKLADLPQNRILHPWQECFRLLKQRPDFARFQWFYMIGGGAFMFMGAAFPIYYVDQLALSYSDISIGRFFLMALGVALSSFLWKRGLTYQPINTLARLVLVGFTLFPILLLVAQNNVFFFYAAFLLYGAAQAGSQLLWNLSGTIFAAEQNSLPFTNVNILMLGIRGAIAPLLGGYLCASMGANMVIVSGSIILSLGLCLLSHRTQKAKLLVKS